MNTIPYLVHFFSLIFFLALPLPPLLLPPLLLFIIDFYNNTGW